VKENKYDEYKFCIEKQADFRLRIDYETFLSADYATRKILIIRNVIQSIRILGGKAKSDFNVIKLEQDVLQVFDIDVSIFTDEYYVVCLRSEKQVFVMRKNGLWIKIKVTEVFTLRMKMYSNFWGRFLQLLYLESLRGFSSI